MKQVYFDDLGSFDEYGLRLVRFHLEAPETKTYYVDVPYSDGHLDLTEALTGEPKYHMRPLVMEFWIKPDLVRNIDMQNKIRGAIHGKRLNIRYSEEPDMYLQGRCHVAIEPDGVIKRVTVEATCEPYKRARETTSQTITIPSGGTTTLTFYNNRMKVQPKFTATHAVQIKKGTTTINMNPGTQTFRLIQLYEGETALAFTGSVGSKVTVEYVEGWL